MAENTVTMEGVTLIFRNFEGKERRYNKAGDRNFGVLLDDTIAEAMLADGWNVKYLQPREDDDPEAAPQAWLPVGVDFEKYKPPRIFVITSRGRTALDEDTCVQIDWADIQNVDLIVRPYNWSVDGKEGVKAYLQSMYVTVNEDELEQKYAMLESQSVGDTE